MKKSEKLHKNVMNTAKYSFSLKPDVISFKKSLIWDQSQHSSSKRLKVIEVWSETSPLMSEKKKVIFHWSNFTEEHIFPAIPVQRTNI